MRTLRFQVAPLLLCLATFAACAYPAPARAAMARLALIIANAAYPDSDAELPTPINDAATLSEDLTRRGFAVEVVKNLGKDGMQAAVDGFLRRIEPGSVALVFYGGYAIQASRKNYLIPVDARIWSESDVLREGVGTDRILADMAARGAATRVVILDASRRNPFERRYRSFSLGLAPAAMLPGTLVLYSAAPGSVVNETTATRSLFVTELAKQIGVPAISAEQAFGATRDALSRATRNQQVPALVSGLTESFSFDPSYVKPAAAVPSSADTAGVKPLPETPQPQAPEPARPPADVKLPPLPLPDAPVLAEPKLPPAPPPEDKTVDTKPPGAESPGSPGSKPSQMASKDATPSQTAEDEAVRDFQDAKILDTKQSYTAFLDRHPAGALAAQARAEIARIEASHRDKPRDPPAKAYTAAEQARKAALDQRIAKNPRDEQAYYERGQFFAQHGDTGPAIADFDQSIRMKPDNPGAFNNRCWMRAVANELPAALSDCDQALKLHPNLVDALDSRGFVNLKAGRFWAAVADYDAALKIDAGHSSSYFGRGIAKRRLGQTAQAEKDIANALQLNASIGEEFAGYGLR